MNDLRKTTITTLEVAEMMEVSHSDLLKKIEGRKTGRDISRSLTKDKCPWLISFTNLLIWMQKGKKGRVMK